MSHQPSLQAFDRTTSLWGNVTLGAGLVLATFMPFYLVFFADVNVSFGQIFTAWLSVAAVFGVLYFIEPVTYYPVLGKAGMYQAFMIGNISNKLLPAAIVAQSTLRVKPGTPQASFVATAAICGAALVHVISLFLFVGLLGTWLVAQIPAEVTEVARTYILPAILGGVGVQLATSIKQPRATLIALTTAVVVIFGLVVWFPALKSAGVGIVVLVTIVLTWTTRNRDNDPSQAPTVSAMAEPH